jgi:hypothetical protein
MNFAFCWPCSISIHACNETNPMHRLSSVHSVATPLHVSGLLVAHRQEVTMLYILIDCRRVCTTCTNCHIYTLLAPDDGLLASPKHVEVSLVASSLLCDSIIVEIRCVNVRRNTTVFSNCWRKQLHVSALFWVGHHQVETRISEKTHILQCGHQEWGNEISFYNVWGFV